MAGITGRNDILLLFDEFGVLNHLPCLSTEEISVSLIARRNLAIRKDRSADDT